MNVFFHAVSRYLTAPFIFLVLTVPVLRPAPVSANAPPVLVGPNVLVTHDIDAPHHEVHAAVDPANPQRLLSGITSETFGGGMFDNLWASKDGGYSWIHAIPNTQGNTDGGDPQVAFGTSGSAYFVTLMPDHDMKFFRSTNGGITWNGPMYLGRQDHEQIAVDWMHDRYRGRVYISGENPYHPKNPNSDNTLQLWRSDDDGKNFDGPHIFAASQVAAPPGLAHTMVAAWGLDTFTDGSLVAGITRFPRNAYKQAYLVATSSDGGTSFGPEHVVEMTTDSEPAKDLAAKRASRRRTGDLRFDWGDPTLTVDQSNGPYRNRLYAIWGNGVRGPARLFIAYSANRGVTWSKPRIVDRLASVDDGDIQPAIVVNNRGTLGIFFYRVHGNRPNTFDAYFVASVDGGQNVLPAQRVSTQTSYPFSRGNFVPFGDWEERSKTDTVEWILNEFNYHPFGGDYMTLTADSNGIFHPFWTDSRSGTYQLYTAPVSVGALPSLPEGPEQSLNGSVGLVFEQVHCDFAASVCDVPIRLKNLSHYTLSGPVAVTLKRDPRAGKSSFGIKPVGYRVLNAPNGKTGPGASFDYTASLGDWHRLLPGAITNPVVWRFHFDELSGLEEQFHFDITGRVAGRTAAINLRCERCRVPDRAVEEARGP